MHVDITQGPIPIRRDKVGRSKVMPTMASLWSLLAMLSSLVTLSSGVPACGPDVEVCEFTLVVDAKLTMMWDKILTYPYNGSLYEYTVTDPSTSTPVPEDEVITTDGWESPRLVMVINGTIPGPAIEVWEGQIVKVHVINRLHNDGTAIHWHGIHQAGTPYMDGVPFVSQCPILPGQTFTYRFTAAPKGTFWYHSHMGSQRTMGYYGPFIIHERQPNYPRYDEMIWTITDWNHDYDSEVTFYKMIYGIYEGRSKFHGTRSLDGSRFSMFRYQSGLLNGKGRYYNPLTGQHNGAPLSRFTVRKDGTYRVRLIAAGELYPFRISIDCHPMTVIASDGYYLEPITVESLIINPGERYDFIINTTKPIGNFWIRGETLEVGVNHTIEAILHYEGAPTDVDPTTRRQNCTEQRKCVVINCPFTYFPRQDNIRCISFDQLKAAEDDHLQSPAATEGQFGEFFLNWAFPGEHYAPGSVNGRVFEAPGVAALPQLSEVDTLCKPGQCGEDKLCHCSWSISLDYQKTYQLVFLNMGKGKGWAHPIHSHGHSFYVLKMGYGIYNETTGKIMFDNPDINCRGNPDPWKTYCNDATWSDPSWLHGNVPGLELSRPPRKDTLIVPSGGYAVVRIKADNPGLWIWHCHIQIHSMGGMAMLLAEALPHIPSVPPGLPTCRSYPNFASVEQEASTQTASSGSSASSTASMPSVSSSSSSGSSSRATTSSRAASSSQTSPSSQASPSSRTSPSSQSSSSSRTSPSSEESSSSRSSPSSEESTASGTSGRSRASSPSPSTSQATTRSSSPSMSPTTAGTRSSSSRSTTVGSDDSGSSSGQTNGCSPSQNTQSLGCQEQLPEAMECSGYSYEVFWAVVGCLIVFVVILLAILMAYICLNRASGARGKTYSLEPTHDYKGSH